MSIHLTIYGPERDRLRRQWLDLARNFEAAGMPRCAELARARSSTTPIALGARPEIRANAARAELTRPRAGRTPRPWP